MKRVRILAVAAALALSVLGVSPAMAAGGPDIPSEIPGGSPPIWDRCGLPLSGC